MERHEQRSRSFVRMIDLLYGVVIAQGFYRLASNLDLLRPASYVSASMLLFLLAMLVAGRDWVTFHDLVRRRPHRSVARVVIDCLILFLFFLLVHISTEQEAGPAEVVPFTIVLAVYSGLLLVWELLELWEYREDRAARMEIRREIGWNVVYVVLATAWAALAWVLGGVTTGRGAILTALALIVLLIVVTSRYGRPQAAGAGASPGATARAPRPGKRVSSEEE